MDALLDLLETTGDALAAEWNLRSVGLAADADWSVGAFKPTIH